MTATPLRVQGKLWLLITALLLLTLADAPCSADDAAAPTPEETTRYLEWYRQQRWQNPSSAADTMPTREDLVRFREWYKHFGAPQPISDATTNTPTEPTPEEVTRFIEWYKHNSTPPPTPADVARLVEWYQHNGAPSPIAAAPSAPTPTNGDAARFLEAYQHRQAPPGPPPASVARFVAYWYKHEGAPRPSGLPAPPPTRADVVCFLEWYKRNGAPTPVVPGELALTNGDVTGYLEAYRHSNMPAVSPLPVTTPTGTQPSGDHSVQTVAAQNVVPAPPPPLPIAFVEPPNGGSSSTSDTSTRQSAPLPRGTPRHDGSPSASDTTAGGFLDVVSDGLCGPDPYYESNWNPLADAAFFVEAARPQSQQSLGWDAGRNLVLPDRAEYFWARADGNGKGPNPANHANPNGLLGEKNVSYNDFWLYTEVAFGNMGGFVYLPYRSLDGNLVGHAAGFSDMQVGAKALLFDTERLQIALELRADIPTGDAAKGLGNGHVSLEPGLIVGVKLGPETYFQGQIAEWIPIGGDPDYEGAILEYHMSLNQVLCHLLPEMPLVGTAEFNGWTFESGHYTDPLAGAGQHAGGGTYASMGPGLRLFFCDKVDFGLGTAFAVTDRHFADQLFRSEFRWRF